MLRACSSPGRAPRRGLRRVARCRPRCFFFFQAEDGIRDYKVTGVQTCALPISAKASAQYFARVFGPDGFWLEVQSHGIADERVVAAGMFRLAAELGLPVVATNDAHYLKKEDAEAHDVLLAIGTGKDLDDPNRFRFFGQESYVKSEPEMAALFARSEEHTSELQSPCNLVCRLLLEKKKKKKTKNASDD